MNRGLKACTYILNKIYFFFKVLVVIIYLIFKGLWILFYTVCKGLVMVIGLLFILSYIGEFFDRRPFKFEYLYPVKLGQAFLDSRYPISPHLSLSYVLDDLKKAGAKCDDGTSMDWYAKEKNTIEKSFALGKLAYFPSQR